jgi:hypothetical protein
MPSSETHRREFVQNHDMASVELHQSGTALQNCRDSRDGANAETLIAHANHNGIAAAIAPTTRPGLQEVCYLGGRNGKFIIWPPIARPMSGHPLISERVSRWYLSDVDLRWRP